MTKPATITIDEADATVTVRDDDGERRLAMTDGARTASPSILL